MLIGLGKYLRAKTEILRLGLREGLRYGA
jgi:hypothetical protein